jgi:hypothetical protein
MSMISITDFMLQFPRVSKRLLPPNAAQRAINCRISSGKLQSLFANKREASAVNSTPLSIYRERETGNWLDWESDVDVIRSPLDTTPDTLIYTGDGRPQIRAVGSSTHYDLGLPAPLAAPTTETGVETNSGNITSVSRIILASQSMASSVVSYMVIPVVADGENPVNFLIKNSTNVEIIMYANAYDQIFYWSLALARFTSPPNEGEIAAIYTSDDGLIAKRDTVGDPHAITLAPPSVVYVDTLTDWNVTDVPTAGTYYYVVANRTPETNVSNPGLLSVVSTYNMEVEARVSNRTRIVSETDTELVLDARVQFSDISGTGGMSAAMNLKVFSVINIVDSKTFDIEATIEGTYTSGGVWTQYWTAGDVESRAYRYTYVATINGVDYEGPGSEASGVIDAGQGQPVTVTGFAAFPVDWNSPADRIRLYRFAAVTSTTGQYQFVAEFSIDDSSYTDVVLGENLGESLPDPDREPPPEDLKGLIELPSGGAAGFVGKTVYFAIPNQLHAWPLDYAKSAHEEVVSIGAFGSSIAVATKGQPYIMTGTEPADMTMDRLETGQPSLSKDGSVDFGYAWVYPAKQGLVVVSTGNVDIVTKNLFDERQWGELNPASFMAARHHNYYVCFYEKTSGEQGGFMFDPLAPQNGVAFLDYWANAAWTDPSSEDLYIAQGSEIKKFDAGEIEMDKIWRSKEFIVPECTMSCAQVMAPKYPVSISLVFDQEEVASIRVYNSQAFRLPPVCKGTQISIEVRGAHQVDTILVAENMEELGNWRGGA